ncbi:hypothetical protein CTEN210_06183 [Chaetoceros tenuissimus]|uniref:J domain-containing protein n=1 Tax=Chaetoceros tenuissimus TaxID=426638 RepID=A0AAD3CPD3_9STRA|nr:hypothetical protein CTEN210_06183 [Chaetoceros tenuissimus]
MMDVIKFAYGAEANLYTDVLKVVPQASEHEIQKAFVARRYELFNELQQASSNRPPKNAPSGSPVSGLSERQFAEKKMDALIASYRLLSDSSERHQYNLSLSLTAAKAKKVKQAESSVVSPSGVQHFDNSFESVNMNDSAEKRSKDPNNSRDMATPYSNPNILPSRTKQDSTSPIDAKKKLFNSPDLVQEKRSKNEQGILKNANGKSTSTKKNVKASFKTFDNQYQDSDTSSFRTDGSSLEDDSSFTDGTDEFGKLRRREDELKMKKSQKQAANGSPDRKVRWAKSAKVSPKKVKKRRERSDSAEDDNLSSWFGDGIGKELAGAASDTMLAFQQIFSAFSIDEDAIDAVSNTVVHATEDLEDNLH